MGNLKMGPDVGMMVTNVDTVETAAGMMEAPRVMGILEHWACW